MAETFGFKLSEQPVETRNQVLQMILENVIYTRATVEALAEHVNLELAKRDHPDSDALGVKRSRQLTSRLGKLVEQQLERLSGESTGRQCTKLEQRTRPWMGKRRKTTKTKA